jgi:hypothetical protein
VQNTILKSFGYIIYQPTPPAYLQEIWKVCPTLRTIRDGNLTAWRTNARVHALELAENCLLGKSVQNSDTCLALTVLHIDQEAMNYPVSYIAAGAMLEALHVYELHQQCDAHSEGRYWDPQDDVDMETSPEVRVCVACVSKEMCDAMQIAPVRVLLISGGNPLTLDP